MRGKRRGDKGLLPADLSTLRSSLSGDGGVGRRSLSRAPRRRRAVRGRKDIYAAACDYKVDAGRGADEVIEDIIELI